MSEQAKASSAVAEAILARLKQHGVDYLFANGGTDFGPIIEALAKGKAEGPAYPEALVMPHETAAVGMAHGYYLATGRAQAVMVHTNVGLANTAMALINAAAEQIPILVCSGRTPVTETGFPGSRSAPINWGQDMRDQAGLVREAVKWDAELRYPEQAVALVDRAMAIAQSAPQGPVYLSLPREALCARPNSETNAAHAPPVPVSIGPDPDATMRAAGMMAAARSPLIIAQRVEDATGFAALQEFAETFAIPVVEFWPSRIALSSHSPMHAGFDPHEDLRAADVIVVQDALVPWIPARAQPRHGCKIVQVGADPLHARFPMRGFGCDATLAGTAAQVYPALGSALAPLLRDRHEIENRFNRLAEQNAQRRERRAVDAAASNGAPMTKAWVSRCLCEALGPDSTIVSEIGADPSAMNRTRPQSYFGHALSGGLGSGLPIALGLQLADRTRIVAATMGDGSYMFANPAACHQIAEALRLPVLIVVMNNRSWHSVKKAALDLFPDGYAARSNAMPVTSLELAPDYCRIAEASRGHAERVEDGAALPAALARALSVVREERRHALLDVAVVPGASQVSG